MEYNNFNGDYEYDDFDYYVEWYNDKRNKESDAYVTPVRHIFRDKNGKITRVMSAEEYIDWLDSQRESQNDAD